MRLLLRALGAVLVLAGVLLAVTSSATAQTLPPLVTDYANYPDTPQALLGDSCDFAGITGASFSLNGAAPVGSLSALPDLQLGDVVTMAWASVGEGCFGSVISLVVKVAKSPFFDVNDNQLTFPDGGYVVASLPDGPEGGGPGSLTIAMPDLAGFGLGCNYQADAVVGVPLEVVGPSGSFYSASSRGDDRRTTLISAKNGAYPICVAQVTTTTAPTTTTSTPTSTTEPPTTTTAPAPPTTGPPATSPSTTAAAVRAQRLLADTGSTPWPALAGVLAVGLGALLLLAGRRRTNPA